MKPLKPQAALPTLLTIGNAFCGFLSITYIIEAARHISGPTSDGSFELAEGFYSNLQSAVLVLFVAMAFDFLDGKVARLTKSESFFGVQVDSLSDVISFGVVPAAMFKLLCHYENLLEPRTALILASFYLCCSVLRLARFNVEADLENDDHRHFKGLPSPAAAAGVASMLYLCVNRDNPDSLRNFAQVAFIVVVPVLGLLMWTKLPYVHLANTLLTEKRSMPHLLIILISIAVVAWRPAPGAAVLMIGYALHGPILYVWNLCTGRTTVEGESLL